MVRMEMEWEEVRKIEKEMKEWNVKVRLEMEKEKRMN